jgi:hypothetical protein
MCEDDRVWRGGTVYMSESRACEEHSVTAALLHRCLTHTILRFNYLTICSPLKVVRSGRNSIRSTKLFSKTVFQTMAGLTPSVLDIFHCVRNIYFTLCFGSQICFHFHMADCHYNYMFLYFVFHIMVLVGICHRTLRILLFYAMPNTVWVQIELYVTYPMYICSSLVIQELW